MEDIKLSQPTFIISVDVELLWGQCSIPTAQAVRLLRGDSQGGRGAIDHLLQLFARYQIPATWAIVGHLFLEHCEGDPPHKNMPRFRNDWYSSDPCTDIHQAPLYYGKDIVERTISSPVAHEIGYHSFSHVPFSECSPQVALAEVEEGLKLAQELGTNLKSFVFPYNKVGHLDILKQKGFKIYRGETLVRAHQGQNFLTLNLSRAIDRFIAPPAPIKRKDGIYQIAGSMYFGDVPFLQPFLLPKAWIGLERAIRTKQVFHVWLHCWTLLSGSLIAKSLEKLLAHVAHRRSEGKLRVTTMGDLAAYLENEKVPAFPQKVLK